MPDRLAGSFVGATSFVLSGMAFVVGLAALYQAEGPGSPDIRTYLASPAGRLTFTAVSASLTVAVILLLVGMLTVCLALYSIRPYPAVLAGALAAVAVPIFIGFLSIQYALVAIAQEGVSPTDESYRVIGLLAHAAADWGGWTGIVLLCASLLTIGAAMLRCGFNRLVAYWGIVTAVIGLLLIAAGFGFAFTLLLALWEWVAAVALLRRRLLPSKSSGSTFHSTVR